ncbi:MAG: glycoside hydrolase family 3 protein [Anaerolineae bacterium]|nr:glycoside hydrolase family 3 protein [Anaerolineae bacterium]
MDEAALRKRFLPPYRAAVDAGALSIMASFSSWNGVKMHAQKYLLSDVLKGELGFQGFIVSDWGAIDQIANRLQGRPSSRHQRRCGHEYGAAAVRPLHHHADPGGGGGSSGVDDAVRRILIVKFALGLFENPLPLDPDAGVRRF